MKEYKIQFKYSNDGRSYNLTIKRVVANSESAAVFIIKQEYKDIKNIKVLDVKEK